MKESRKAFVPVLLVFVMLNSFFLVAGNLLQKWQADRNVLIIGNLLLFLITILSFAMAQRGLKQSNPHAFVRSVYGSIMIKLFICIIIAFIYIASYGKEINKPALFTCMGLYLLYTFLEVTGLMKLLRQRSHG